MAIMIPPMPFDFHGSYGEKEVFEALSTLSTDSYVFHSLRWVGRTPRSPSQGEADFVIFDPKRGILILEVKSGIITYHDRMWHQMNMATGVTKIMQDPEEQASRSKFVLLEALHGKVPHKECCLVCHAVWFPSAPVDKSKLPLNLSPLIAFDADDLQRPIQAIEGAFDYWQKIIRSHSITSGTAKKIFDVLAPTLSIVPSPRFMFETRERQFLRLTNEQARVLDFLEEQEKAVISGTAGTGKTLIALEKARRLSSSGRRVLLLCYNAALKNHLRKVNKSGGISIESFDSLASRYIMLQNNNYDQLKTDFIELISGDSFIWEYTDVIIDEGQDFQDDWIEWLRYLTPSSFYVFYDPNQTIFTDKPPQWLNSAECKLTLKRNCRNTFPVHRTSHRFLDISIDKREESVDGQKPIVWKCNSGKEVSVAVGRMLHKLLKKDGLKPEEIAILSTKTISSSLISRYGLPSGTPLAEEPQEGKVCFTTIKKFKGLESHVVFLVDLPSSIPPDDLKRLLYVGASRAKHELHIFMNLSEDSQVAGLVEALAKGRKMQKNMNGLARLLDIKWNEYKDMEVI